MKQRDEKFDRDEEQITLQAHSRILYDKAQVDNYPSTKFPDPQGLSLSRSPRFYNATALFILVDASRHDRGKTAVWAIDRTRRDCCIGRHRTDLLRGDLKLGRGCRHTQIALGRGSDYERWGRRGASGFCRLGLNAWEGSASARVPLCRLSGIAVFRADNSVKTSGNSEEKVRARVVIVGGLSRRAGT